VSIPVTRGFVQRAADWLTVKKFVAAIVTLVVAAFLAGVGLTSCYQRHFASPDSIVGIRTEMHDSIAAVRSRHLISDAVSDTTRALVAAFGDSLNSVNRKLNYLICKDGGDTSENCLRKGSGI
jgi:hypothetical protein